MNDAVPTWDPCAGRLAPILAEPSTVSPSSATTTCSPDQKARVSSTGRHVHRVGLAGGRHLDDEVVHLRPVALPRLGRISATSSWAPRW